MRKQVSFPVWPKWNYHFPERDVDPIVSVKYWPKDPQLQLPGPESDENATYQLEYPLEKVRLTCGVSGVSGITFKEKHHLPPLAERADAVTIEYEVPDEV